jgi:hypothetical protein
MNRRPPAVDNDSTPDRFGRTLARAYLALCLVYMMWAVWTMVLPEHKRTTLKLALLRSSAQATNRLARRTGAACLAQEAQTGRSDYAVPYRLSLARDWLMAAYDRSRAVL